MRRAKASSFNTTIGSPCGTEGTETQRAQRKPKNVYFLRRLLPFSVPSVSLCSLCLKRLTFWGAS